MTKKHDQSESSFKRRGLFWPIFVLVLLIGHVSILTTAAILASTDPSVAAEPDFYEKALAWDADRKLVREPSLDGYEVTPVLAPPTSQKAEGQLSLEITREGVPVQGDTLTATIFHAARSGDRQHLTLTEVQPGVYVAPALLNRDGHWEVRFELTTPERVYRFIRHIEVYGTTK